MTLYQRYEPPARDAREALDRRKRLHAALVGYIGGKGGWVSSVPGAQPIRMECPIGSQLPDDLRGKGYDVTPCGMTMRIDPHGHREMVAQRADGQLEVTATSTRPMLPRSHATIVQVEIFELSIPRAPEPAGNRIPE